MSAKETAEIEVKMPEKQGKWIDADGWPSMKICSRCKRASRMDPKNTSMLCLRCGSLNRPELYEEMARTKERMRRIRECGDTVEMGRIMTKEITKDTQRAIEAIKPIAEELGINIDADEQFMYLNNQAIGIGSNSTFATLMEFIGFVFMTTYNKNVIVPHNGKVSNWLRSLIKRNWVDMKTVGAVKAKLGQKATVDE